MRGSASVTYTARPGGWAGLLATPTSPYGQHLTRVGNRAVNAAKPKANVETGQMRSRIEFRLVVTGGRLQGRLEARTAYARWVHDGNGRYRGNPFLTDAVREVLR